LYRRAHTKKKSESNQQGGRHLPRCGQHGKQDADEEKVGLDREQQPAPVEGVGQHSTGEREQHDGQRGRRLHQRDERCCVGRVDDEPLRTDGLHPGADPANQHTDPEPAVRAMTEGCPRWRVGGPGRRNLFC
jgi:hypothetical protein